MDPHKGGVLQSIITFFLNIALYVVYGILKIIYLFKKENEFVEPSQPSHPFCRAVISNLWAAFSVC